MKKIITLTITTFITIGLTACGSSGSYQTEIKDDTQQEKITIDSQCTDDTDVANYTPLEKGDEVVPDNNDTVVTFYHNEENQKVVCLVQGSAYILRDIE